MAATTLQILYGYSVDPKKPDPVVNLIERQVRNLTVAYLPMKWAVDVIPALKHLPECLPGMGFKSTAREFKKINNKAANSPYLFVQKQMANDSHKNSFLSQVLKEKHSGIGRGSMLSIDDEAIKWMTLTLFSGGSDTTVETIRSFVLVMIMYPDVQLRAQEEIDRVVGTERLPQIKDRPDLPYVQAILKETLRWSPLGVMGFPHSVEDEIIICRRYRVPKGAVILPAVWWFRHDPAVYSNPTQFEPERFLAPRNEPDPRAITFGFGRRACPGRVVAEAGLFITMAQTLASFRLLKAVGKNGAEINVSLELTGSLLARPKPFPSRIVLRSQRHAEMIRNIEIEQPCDKGDAEILRVILEEPDA